MKIVRLEVEADTTESAFRQMYPPGTMIRAGSAILEIFRTHHRGGNRWTMWAKRKSA